MKNDNSTTPLVSVLVAIYNVEKYLPQCIDSIISQTYHNLEIILVDDGSTDNSGKICDEYAAKDSRVKVIHKLNGGLVSARNAGLDVATGEYVGFVDGDDWIEPQTYQTALELLQQYQVDLVKWGNNRVIDKNITPIHSLHTRGVYVKSAKQQLMFNIIKGITGTDNNLVNCLFKKNVIDRFSIRTPVDISQGEDLYFLTAYISRIQTIYLAADLCFYNYRQNPLSLTKHYSPKYITEIATLVDRFNKLLQSLPDSNFYQSVFNYRTNILIFYLLFMQADFDFSKIPNKIKALDEFYNQFQTQFQTARYHNTIPWSKRIPVILFHKQYFCLALITSYVFKTAYLGKIKISNIFHIGGILCFK